jgi:hypothetical protein
MPPHLGVSVNGTDQSTAFKARGKLPRADEELPNKGRNSLKAIRGQLDNSNT